MWLAADQRRAAGLLLQRVPARGGLPRKHANEEDWERVLALASTLTSEELLALPTEELLYRLFHEEAVRLFDREPLAFRCSCSRERIADSLRAIGREELDAIVAEQGAVTVDCEFCNRQYRFDQVDVATLLLKPSEATMSADPGRGVKH
jgi:molecular chaperone Hsp33